MGAAADMLANTTGWLPAAVQFDTTARQQGAQDETGSLPMTEGEATWFS